MIDVLFQMTFSEDLSHLLEQIQRLRDKLEIVEFEQQWFEAQTEQQAKGINIITTRLYKPYCLLESVFNKVKKFLQ